jgi:hypothetical protein
LNLDHTQRRRQAGARSWADFLVARCRLSALHHNIAAGILIACITSCSETKNVAKSQVSAPQAIRSHRQRAICMTACGVGRCRAPQHQTSNDQHEREPLAAAEQIAGHEHLLTYRDPNQGSTPGQDDRAGLGAREDVKSGTGFGSATSGFSYGTPPGGRRSPASLSRRRGATCGSTGSIRRRRRRCSRLTRINSGG